MAIILRRFRPLISVLDPTAYDSVPKSVQKIPNWEMKIQRVVRSVGRLNLRQGPMPYVGTVVIAGEKLVIAATHLLTLLVDKRTTGDSQAKLDPKLGAHINFSADGESGEEIEVEEVIFSHPALDVAALRTKQALPTEPLQLEAVSPESLANRQLLVAGYPSTDLRNDPQLIQRVMPGEPHTLHISFGKALRIEDRPAPGNTEMQIPMLLHDCSTLGGFSGGPLMDLESGHVVGIHIGGHFLQMNFAIPTWEFGRDPRVRIHPIAFSAPASPWDHLWSPLVTKPVQVRSGMFNTGATVQHWEDDKLIWEKEVHEHPLRAVSDLIHELYKETEEIRHFAGFLDESLRSHIGKHLSSMETAERLAELLKMRNLIDDKFFSVLIDRHHHAYHLIKAVQFRWQDLLETVRTFRPTGVF